MDVFINSALPIAKQSEDDFLIGNVEKAIATVFMNADRRVDAAAYLLRAIDHIERSPMDNAIRKSGVSFTKNCSQHEKGIT